MVSKPLFTKEISFFRVRCTPGIDIGTASSLPYHRAEWKSDLANFLLDTLRKQKCLFLISMSYANYYTHPCAQCNQMWHRAKALSASRFWEVFQSEKYFEQQEQKTKSRVRNVQRGKEAQCLKRDGNHSNLWAQWGAEAAQRSTVPCAGDTYSCFSCWEMRDSAPFPFSCGSA